MERDKFIAAIRHIGWVYYQIASGQPYNEIGNEDQLKSLLDGIKYADEHPDMTPEQNHENWMKMKISQGWEYGSIKDFDLKTHPDLVPFDELPDIEKRKDIADYIGVMRRVTKGLEGGYYGTFQYQGCPFPAVT